MRITVPYDPRAAPESRAEITAVTPPAEVSQR
ncbi:hypothetical protein SAMN05216559_3649 [Halomicrobium zhouii]|uniref:Uncharacterized protein n=1 Tax=Halomicrobium zhouii TaxID=767519 RepID=A0A1I6M322_9EURY|nr:hypothetical protein SAMN05216559_3649 [Halomicrobium zhouii]